MLLGRTPDECNLYVVPQGKTMSNIQVRKRQALLVCYPMCGVLCEGYGASASTTDTQPEHYMHNVIHRYETRPKW